MQKKTLSFLTSDPRGNSKTCKKYEKALIKYCSTSLNLKLKAKTENPSLIPFILPQSLKLLI